MIMRYGRNLLFFIYSYYARSANTQIPFGHCGHLRIESELETHATTENFLLQNYKLLMDRETLTPLRYIADPMQQESRCHTYKTGRLRYPRYAK